MAQFKDVLSTTTKVILALAIISAVIGVGSLLLVKIGSIPSGDPDADCQRDTACREAHAETERLVRQFNAENESKIRDVKVRLAYIDGDAVGDLYSRCTSGEPPKNTANQKRCQTVIDRIEKEIATLDAADAKAKAKW
jgi:hypothetical protein